MQAGPSRRSRGGLHYQMLPPASGRVPANAAAAMATRFAASPLRGRRLRSGGWRSGGGRLRSGWWCNGPDVGGRGGAVLHRQSWNDGWRGRPARKRMVGPRTNRLSIAGGRRHRQCRDDGKRGRHVRLRTAKTAAMVAVITNPIASGATRLRGRFNRGRRRGIPVPIGESSGRQRRNNGGRGGNPWSDIFAAESRAHISRERRHNRRSAYVWAASLSSAALGIRGRVARRTRA